MRSLPPPLPAVASFALALRPLLAFAASPPVVVTDPAMAGRDGRDLARELHRRPDLAAALVAAVGEAAHRRDH